MYICVVGNAELTIGDDIDDPMQARYALGRAAELAEIVFRISISFLLEVIVAVA